MRLEWLVWLVLSVSIPALGDTSAVLTTGTGSGFPVVMSETLFRVYSSLGAFSAAERVQAIERRLAQLVRDPLFEPDSLHVVESELTTDVAYRDRIILSVTSADAAFLGRPRAEVAQEYARKVGSAIAATRTRSNLKNILIGIALVLLILAVVVVLVYYANRLFRALMAWIARQKGIRFKGIRLRTYELLTPEREVAVLVYLAKVLRIVVYVLIGYLALPLLFSVMPWTRGIAARLFQYILSPLRSLGRGFVSYLPDLLAIIVIYVIVHYVIRFLKFIAKEIERGALAVPGFYADWAQPTFSIVRVVLYVILLIAIFPHLPGSNSKVFQGISVFLGLLISLGSSSSIANAMAGLVITYMRPFKVGDRVKIGDVVGDVVERTLLVTRVRTIKNEFVSIANSTVLSSHTTNFTPPEGVSGLILHTTVTIGYDAPWRKVHQLLIDAALSTNGILADPAPFVLQTSLDDFYVSYEINAYTRDAQRMAVIYSELHQNIQDKFNEAGVEIMSPHYQQLRDGNEVAIPPEYRPPDYTPGSFRVNNDSNPKPK